MKNCLLLTALPGHPATQPANYRAYCCMQAAVQEALPLSTRPVHVSGGSFHPRCSNRSATGLPWPLAAASGTYRVSLGCLAADQAGQELLHTEVLVLCLCGTLTIATIATDVPGTRRFRHASHVSKPSLSRGSIAVEKKKEKKRDPGASAVESG